jgi:homoserine O-acetyltransferase/O-succinyltransferase
MYHSIYRLGGLPLSSGETLADAEIAYAVHGKLNSERNNAVLCPTFFAGDCTGYDWLIGSGSPLDTDRYCVVVAGLFGNGFSSSPSNHADGSSFPLISSQDNVMAQYLLVREKLRITQLALVTGWSMGAMHTYQWAVSHPDLVRRIAPICGSAVTSEHNRVFLGGLKAVLGHGGPGDRGLRAVGRVFAGWAASHDFWAERRYRELGFEDREDYLTGFWEALFADKHPEDLMTTASTWENADVGATAGFGGDTRAALASIRAETVTLPGQHDLCFAPADEAEAARSIPRASLRVIPGVWGHLAGSGMSAADRDFVGTALRRLLDREPAVAVAQ